MSIDGQVWFYLGNSKDIVVWEVIVFSCRPYARHFGISSSAMHQG